MRNYSAAFLRACMLYVLKYAVTSLSPSLSGDEELQQNCNRPATELQHLSPSLSGDEELQQSCNRAATELQQSCNISRPLSLATRS